jgi:hypothetical protein
MRGGKSDQLFFFTISIEAGPFLQSIMCLMLTTREQHKHAELIRFKHCPLES